MEKKETQPVWPTRFHLLFSFLLVVIGGVYSWFSYAQWQTMQRSLEIEEQPFVGVQSIAMTTLEAGKPPLVTAVFLNTGKGPALRATHHLALRIGPTVCGKNELTYLPALDLSKVVMYPGLPFASPVPDEQAPPLTANQVEALKQNVVHLCIFGTVDYDDVFDKPHYTHICFYYEPQKSTFNACPYYNEMK